MKTIGLSDVIGPIMVGPSSSHTAGALRIAYMARRLCLAEPKTVEFRLLGSFAHTLTGHGTDKALVAGMLGLAADDLRIRDSFQLAGDAGLAFSFVTLPDEEYDHPNTIDMRIVDAAGNAMSVRGESIGGGAAVIRKIDDIVVRQRDETGVLAHIAQSISDEGVNIATTRMYRERKGDIAYTVLETDQEVDGAAKAAIEDHPAILDVRVIPGDARPGCGSVDAPDAEEALQRFAEADFGTGAALLAWCEKHGTTLSEAFLAREAALAESLGYADRSLAYLHETLDVMKCAAQRPIDEALPSMGGLIGGEARKLADLRERDGELCDDQLSCAIAYAMDVKAIGTMNVEFYSGIGETLDEPMLLPPLMDVSAMDGKRVLVVDDVADSGKTLKMVMDLIDEHGLSLDGSSSVRVEARSAVIYKKPVSIIDPDYVWAYTDKWINFPWSTLPVIKP